MIWRPKRSRDVSRRGSTEAVRRRAHAPERLEQRQMMAADPIHVGVVYIETDYLATDEDRGGDSSGDRFILSFTGGAPDTELKELRILSDKDRDGLSVGDLIFDTVAGGRGKDQAHPFKVSRVLTQDGHEVGVVAEVADGGLELVLRLTNFRAGDRLEFTLDVDEVLRLSPDLAMFNSRLDVIASGQEFQDSILEAKFEAPHYKTANADSIFLNDYGSPSQQFGLQLPPDASADPDSRPNRSAAAVASTVQVPKPVAISGHVWVDNDLDAVRETGEAGLSGVSLALWQRDASGRYVDTLHRTTTDSNGAYQFPKSLGLTPGVYRVVESQPSGLYSVAAVVGSVAAKPSGRVESLDVLSDINLPLGDLTAVNYDFAEAAPSSIGGHVYRDDNDNGRRDAGEVGLPGVRVRLVPIQTLAPQPPIIVTTGADGSYRFDNLVPGTYEIVELDQPMGLADGRDSAGTIGGKTVGVADEPGDAIRSIVLHGGVVGTNYNFGELPLGSLSGFVYLLGPGADCNGIRETAGNTPLVGARLVLESQAGQFIAETVTDSEGAYTFEQLSKGTYRIREFTPTGLLDGKSMPGRLHDVSVGESVDGGLIQSITMIAGGIGTEFNFCEASPAKISGFVYHDKTNDGARGANETGIAKVNLSLVDASGRVVATTMSDSTGRYQFANVLPGEYTLRETQPVGFYDGLDTAGTVRGVRVGRVGTDGDSLTAIKLKQGDEGVEYNFGELVGASLAGQVFVDVDEDCVRDADELPLAGVTVQIFDQAGKLVATTQSGADGRYQFKNLRPGEYTVVEIQPEGYFEGGAKVGSSGGVVAGPNRIGTIGLASAEVAVDYDFCERPPAEISGFVFSDRNQDRRFDGNEEAISEVRVELYDSSGTRVATTSTDATGRYRFSYLPAGQYTVREIQPTGWIQGTQIAGSAGGNDTSQDVISAIPIAWGDRLTQYNFTELEPGSISGTVYVDLDADCKRDSAEPPLAGVVIQLRNEAGRVVATTTTNADGRYHFEGLAPGNYQVFEQQPDGYFQGGQSLGSGGGRVIADDLLGLTLTAGRDLTDYDFCELPPSSIAGVVYVDADRDCVRDPEESPLSGVVIQLRDKTGSVVATTKTNAAGRYRFEGLAPGEYQIFEQQPDGYYQGGQTIGTGGGRVLGDDLLGLELPPGVNVVDYDFCELPPSTIAGTVYVDTDRDCERDPNEQPLSGVVIQLRDGTGRVVATTLTNATGQYRFDDLAPGEYQIFEQQPDGYFQGGQTVGTGGGRVIDNDLLGLTLAAGVNVVNYDFCELPPSSIAGVVYVDADRDCERDSDELPLAGVQVQLRDTTGRVMATTQTNTAGHYRFDGLAPGEYQIFEQQPDGYFQGGQTVGSGGGRVIGDDLLGLELEAGVDLTNYDFCELLPSSISGRIWKETDLNRVFNPGEEVIPGVVVELLNSNNQVVAQTQTTTHGVYRFDGLAPGVYSVRETQPTGLFHGGQVVGTAGGRMGGDDLLVGITLHGGTRADEYNFPEVPPATIAGYVYQDGGAIPLAGAPDPATLRQYRDGIFTSDDKPLTGVVLELRNVLGEHFTADRALPGVYPAGAIRVVTNADGYYEFTGLRPGTYHVYQIQPDDYIDGLDVPGTTGGVAVNPADTLDSANEIIVQTLAASELTDPHSDAILKIALVAGGTSVSNNFSEIIVQLQIPQLETPKPETPRVDTPIETFLQPVRLVSFASPLSYRTPMVADDEWAVSWHLSVVNGGYPRGGDDDAELIKLTSSSNYSQQWDAADRTQGRWSLVDRRGQKMDASDRLLLGEEDALALSGDFDGDGQDEAAIYVGGRWFIDFNGNGRWDEGDLWIRLGSDLDRPVVGDWDGDGKDDIGIFGRQWQRDPQRIKHDPGLPDPANTRRRVIDSEQPVATEARGEDRQRLLRRGTEGALRADAVDHVFRYGEQVDTPVVGDWNGDGIDQIAVYRSGQWMLDTNGDGRWTKQDTRVAFGSGNDEPVAGDFNGDGIDEIGVIRGDIWIIDTDGDRRLTGNDLQIHVPRKDADSQPVVGDWDGDGSDEPGYYDYGT